MEIATLGRRLGTSSVAWLLALPLGLAAASLATAAPAELRFVRHTVAPEHPLPGGRFAIEVTIQNAGQGPAGHFRVEARIGQATVGQVDFRELVPGARDSRPLSLTYPGGIRGLTAAPGAFPKEICLDLVINPLQNPGARVDGPRRVCVAPRPLGKPGETARRPPAPPTPGAAPPVPQEPAAPRVPLPVPGTPPAPQAPPGPIEIRIAALDVIRGRLELELENADRERDLRHPLVEVEITQGAKTTPLHKGYETVLRASSTRRLRIPLPEGVQPTDYVEVKVNQQVIGKRSLRWLVEEAAQAEISTAARPPHPGFAPLEVPAGARPLAMYMTLRVNGELGIPSPVPVDAGRTAEVSWDVGMVADRPTGIWLRVRREAEFACSDALAEPGDVISRLEDGVTGSAAISLPEPGPFYVIGCMVRNDATAPRGARYTGDWTNKVPVQHGPVLTLAGGFVAELPPLAPDLVVFDVRLIRSGPDRGRLLIWVSARPVAPGVPPPAGTFPYRVYVVPSDTAAAYRDYGGLSERGRHVGTEWVPEAQTHEGTGQVRNLALFGHGDVIITDFRLRDDQASTVFVVVNPRHDPFGPSERLIGPVRELLPPGSGSPPPDPFYRESNYFNNHRVTTVDVVARGRFRVANNVLDLWIESHGPGWALVGVRYTLWSEDEGLLSLRLSGLELPGYPGPERPAGGRGPTLDQLLGARGFRLTCTAAGSTSRYVDALRGLDRTARFLCRYRQPGIGLVDEDSLGSLLGASPDVGEALRSGDPRLDELGDRLRGTEFGAEVWLGFRVSSGSRGLAEKRFAFGKAFLGGGAPSLPPQIALGAVQAATARRIDFVRGGACIWAVGGGSWPRDLAGPAGLQALVGFRRDYDPGADPFPCWERWTYQAFGLTRFNLDLLDRQDAARLERATLSFLRTGLPVPNDCTSPGALVQVASSGFEGRSGSFMLPSGGRVGDGSVLPGAPAEGGRIAVDATALVREWLRGDRANTGFSLAQVPDRHALGDSATCAAHYGDFRLTLEFARR